MFYLIKDKELKRQSNDFGYIGLGNIRMRTIKRYFRMRANNTKNAINDYSSFSYDFVIES